MKTTTLLPLLLPALAAFATAQTPAHLVGLTRFAPMLRHVDHAPCAMLAQCAVPIPPPAAFPPFAGGTAWDPVRSGAWVSNGVLLAKVDDNCTMQCPPAPIPTLAGNAFVTGMELVEGMNQLWLIDSLGVLHFYTNACPPVPLGTCNTGLGPTAIGNVTTGLAVDELNGIVFIAHPMFPTGPNRIVVSPLGAPCNPVSQFILPTCTTAFGAVTGLACDWGNQVLYATDGVGTVAMTYGWAPPNVLVGPVTCCGAGVAADPMVGLAVRPGRATSVGSSCANGSCAPCPQVHTLRNDPCLGNAQFRLGLDQAPAGALAILAIGIGPCVVPGVALPPLCGPLHTTPLLGTVGPNLTGGTGVCDGSTDFNVPLPVAPGLAGQVFSSQALTICLGGGVMGFGMSNCLSWRLQGN
jgi:hypothetical protein